MGSPVKVSGEDSIFVTSPRTLSWYENLEDSGSCITLYELLAGRGKFNDAAVTTMPDIERRHELIPEQGTEGSPVPDKGKQHEIIGDPVPKSTTAPKIEGRHELIHELGPKGITVLHKGVQHGCSKLVRYILVDMFDKDGYCRCRRDGVEKCALTRERLLRMTCEYGTTAVNLAVVSGSPRMVILLKWAIDVAKLQKSNFNITSDQLPPVPAVNDGVWAVNEGMWEESQYYGTYYINMINALSSIMNQVLNLENWHGSDRGHVDWLMQTCKEHVDFEFLPEPFTFFIHFLITIAAFTDSLFREVARKIMKTTMDRCRDYDTIGDKGDGSMIIFLLTLHDHRGRTFFLIPHSSSVMNSIIYSFPELMPKTFSQLWTTLLNGKDAAGRTIIHYMSMGINLRVPRWLLRSELHDLNWVTTVQPLCYEHSTLHQWCFPELYNSVYYEPCILEDIPLQWPPNIKHDLLQMMIVFKATHMIDIYFTERDPCMEHSELSSTNAFLTAAFFGRTEALNRMFEHQARCNCVHDQGFGNSSSYRTAIHCAAVAGQVKAVQCILKHPSYDPMVQNDDGTALHLLLARSPKKRKALEEYNALALTHALPNSFGYRRIKDDFKELQCDPNASTMFSVNEMTCIDLLLQAGIDIWTPHYDTKELPTPGPTANDEARRWWYEKVVKEVVNVKANINSAANATSVVAALVATASFIGPLQPPLGLSSDINHIETSVPAVRVYLVCNMFSFYLSIASILLAVLPAIPMPKESTFDELFRSQRCLKGATLMLLVSIICILIAFSSASVATVSSKRRDRQLVGSCIAIGGLVCLAVLVIYLIRMLRMLFHKNDRFRRWFAKYMYF